MTTMASSTTKPVEMVRRHQGEIVQAVAQQIHHGEGADQGDRHGDAGNQGGAAIAQEQKDHQDHQHDGDDQRRLNVMQGGLDGGGAVQNNGGFNALGHHRLQKGKLGADAVVGLDDIGARLAEDDDRHRGDAIQVTRGANALGRILYVGYVGKVDGEPVVIADDQGLILIGLRNLVVGDDVRGHERRW